MQQDRAGGSEHIKQNQDNRRILKPPAAQGELPHQPQPQKCPRCESMNTKFCYYNNYSLSQPRYFCKTCRRYWTQGGTLRNVPVGGGCRKGKRAKTSNSASSASSVDQVIKPNFQTSQTSFSLSSSGPGSSTTASISPVGQTGMGTYFNSDAGGFLTSLATIHSTNNQPPAVSFTLNQPLNLGGDLGGNSSNLGLLHGFNAISPFGSSQSRQLSSYFPFEENLVRPSNRAASANNPSQQQNWHQGFPSSANNSSVVSDTTLWSISTTTTVVGNTSKNNTGVGSSSSLNPDHQWPDLPGYGNPP